MREFQLVCTFDLRRSVAFSKGFVPCLQLTSVNVILVGERGRERIESFTWGQKTAAQARPGRDRYGLACYSKQPKPHWDWAEPNPGLRGRAGTALNPKGGVCSSQSY